MNSGTYTIKPFPAYRQATLDVLAASSRKHMIHGLIEVDVTKPRQRLREIKENTSEALSFTGYIIYCLARAVDMNKHMHAYRNWRNQLIIFDEVDVSTTIERLVDGRNEVVPTIIRAANRKSVYEIHQEIRQTQASKVEEAGVFRLVQLYLAIPAFIRRWFFRILDRSPLLMKKNCGTVLVTAVGMFGDGAGWGIPIASHTLNLTVGGIDCRPTNTAQDEKREYLCLTLSFDHDIIDGAPAARFVQRFKELVEGGTGLFEELASNQCLTQYEAVHV
jgi:pyruvate/2-oxoglutarate dehydrogenase complex dihydrolipoamide acyltransferase (E2) component